MSAPAISARDAAALIAAKKNVDWLAIIAAEARGRGMATFASQVRRESEVQSAVFWSIANRLDLDGVSHKELLAEARRVAADGE